RQPARKPLYLQLRDKVDFGRECDGFILDDLQCSRRHFSLTPRGAAVIVEDLGSTNGTFMNGSQLTTSQELAPGSAVRAGGTSVELVVEADDQVEAVRPAPTGVSRETSIELVARTVENERAAAPSIAHHEGTVTIVFSDIESSTEQATRLGDNAWLKVLG